MCKSVDFVVVTLQPEEPNTVTEDRLAMFELIHETTDDDLVRDMLAFAAGRIMELEVEACMGTAPGARYADRNLSKVT